MLPYVRAWLEVALGREEEGQGLVEYALIIALIAVVVAASLLVLEDDITGVFTTIGGSL
jgi:pilus assembly protein Flp/PilA